MTTLISHKYIFIHIPKNAGSSLQSAMMECENWAPIRKFLWKLSMRAGIGKHTIITTGINNRQVSGFTISAIAGHAHALNVKQVLPGAVFDEYFKFAIVRNPWDRCVSRYEYYKMVSGKPDLEFKAYLERDFQPQKLRISDKEGNVMVDFIGRFENLQADVHTIFQRCNLPLAGKDLPFVNRSVRKQYQGYYDDDTRRLVAEKYVEDIEYFDYCF